jgi:Cu(I)/Ag(I) efflux system membrane fusion protein
VEAEVQSLPGRNFEGRVAFIDPVVDPTTRTVGVRVVAENKHGLLRIGDYAKARIDVELTKDDRAHPLIYDPELAGKWISPRHPHVVESAPGACRECGIQLVPAAEFGFAAEPLQPDRFCVVPRDAVLMAAGNSVVYVETAPGRFEIRPVVLGSVVDDRAVVLEGLKEGEQVAASGNFLIDSQMQLAGNPSLIDPTKAQTKPSLPANLRGDTDSATAGIAAALAQLAEADRALAERQKNCPVADAPLGSMGTPIKVIVEGRPVFICCDGCRTSLLAEPAKYLAKLSKESSP